MPFKKLRYIIIIPYKLFALGLMAAVKIKLENTFRQSNEDTMLCLRVTLKR